MSRNLVLSGLLILAAVYLAADHAVDAPKPVETRAGAAATDFVPASFRFAKASDDRPAAEEAAPIGLTASDGTGLALVGLEANGVLEPPLAFTELRLTFDNPRDEVMEGRFRIALPPGAALSRFAMKIGDSWQEGEVVERQRARQVYEDFLHRRQDPALLEQEAGNEFSARVFPIPARGRKELIVSYSHALPRAGEPYVLPLRGLSEIGQLDIRVFLGDRPATEEDAKETSSLGGEVRERRVVELHKQAWTPDRDFEIRQDQVAGRAGLRHGNLAVARVAAPLEAAAPQEIAGLYVLVDSSASRALGYATQARRVEELIAGLRDGAGRNTPLGIAAFDQEVVPIYEGTAGGFGAAEAERLDDRRPLGASDLEAALSWLAGRLDRGRYPRVLLVTDGVATAGDTETRALKAAVRALGEKGVERLDVLAVGGLRDEMVLRELTTGNLKHDGQRLDGAAPLSEIARRLTLACRSGVKIGVEGAAWVWPETLDGVQPGDETLVYADLPAGRPLKLTLDGKASPVLGELAKAERPLLERAWVQARIERLLHLREATHAGDDDLRRAIGREITDLSVRHRVLSPFTAMLVLETEFDYARFGLDRRALADVLTVGAGGLEVRARSRSPLAPGNRRTTPKEELAELQSLGYVGDSDAEDEPVDAGVEGGVVGGVEGGVEGGVVGGVVGGVPGGVMSNAAPPPPPAARMASPEPVQPSEIPAPVTDEAPLRVGGAEAVTEEPEEIVVPEPRMERGRDELEGKRGAPYSGRFAEVMKRLASGQVAPAREAAEAWNAEAPGDVLSLLALGETWEAAGETASAARAYGSLIDLYPSRADLRRLAGERLERLGDVGLELAVDTYRKAVLDRPDHASGHRLLAWALVRAGRFEEAFEALAAGLQQKYPDGRFAGVQRVFQDDLGLVAAAWLRAEPNRRAEVLERLSLHGAPIAKEPSLRFVLSWETDANDVDLHVYDRRGNHASYKQKILLSGGELYEDVTTGYGPEYFVVRDPAERDAAPYKLRVHYYRRGPMGYGMGTVQVVTHDGKGGIAVEPRPFVVMSDDALVDLGAVGGKSGRGKAGG
ncbi:MAG TPA: VIT domain-containing protein [Thermoanaerobaculia bacterium]